MLRGILLIILFLALTPTVEASIKVVNRSTPACYSGEYHQTIQSAVDSAASGDSIIICPGIYSENIDIGLPLEIKSYSQDYADTVVQAAIASDNVFEITAGNVNLSSLTITGANGSNAAGVYIFGAKECNITNNKISGNWYGIKTRSSSNNVFFNNNLSLNTESGIALGTSSNNVIIRNKISYNNYGILLRDSINNLLSNNSVLNNYYSGLFLDFSGSNTIANNNISLNYDYGIYIYSSNSNYIYNNLFNNTYNFYLFSTINEWNTSTTLGSNIIGGPTIGGNLWATPLESGFSQNCQDSDHDRICDSGFVLDDDNIDYLPIALGNIRNLETGKRFSSIQSAIDDPETDIGHTIVVPQGYYSENVKLNKSINLISTGKPTIINASKPDYTLEISVSYVNISGFTITGASSWESSGIFVSNADYCDISNSNISYNWHGITLEYSDNCTLINNSIQYNSGFGVISEYSLSSTISGNSVNLNGATGIHIFSSNNNLLEKNEINYNERGIYLQESESTRIVDNTINSNTYEGITLRSANSNLIRHNNATNGYIGLYLIFSSDFNVISDNNLSLNNRQGVYLSYSQNNTLANNTITLNGDSGIYLRSSGNNNFYNNFFNNSLNVFFYDEAPNKWNTTKRSGLNILGREDIGGNYWATIGGSGFSELCIDEDGNSICDGYYALNPGNVDFFPLFYETDPPIIEIIGNASVNNSLHNSAITFNASVSDLRSNISSCLLELDSINVSMLLEGTGKNVTCGYASYNLTEGEHKYSIYASDASGNINQTSILTLVVDSTPPIVSLVSPIDNYNSSNQSLFFEFTASDNLSSALLCSIYVDGSKEWSGYASNATLPLAEELHSWYVSCSDQAGNRGFSKEYTFLIDLTPPTIDISSPLEKLYSSRQIMLNTSSGEEVETWGYSLNGGGNITFTPAITISISEGLNTLFVYARDYAGNTNSARIDFTVDTIAPSITILSPENTVYADNTITINITTDESSNISYSLNNAENVSSNNLSTSFETYTSGAEGLNCVDIYVRDKAGNLNSTQVCFIIDTVNPLIEVTSPQNHSYGSYTIDLNASSNEAISLWQYSLNGDPMTNFTPNMTINGLEGENNITVYALDSAGNIANTTIYFYIDTIPPEITILTSNNSNFSGEINLSWTLQDSSPFTVDFYLNGSLNRTNTTDGCSFGNLEEGVYLWRIEATDSLGNKHQSKAYIFTVDITAPLIINATISAEKALIQDGIEISVNAVDNSTGTRSILAEINEANLTFSNQSLWLTSEGFYHLTGIYAVDYSGNMGYFPIDSSFAIYNDTTSPSIIIHYPMPYTNLSSNSWELNWSSTDIFPVASAILLDGSIVAEDVETTSGYNILEITASEGFHNILVEVSDTAGNKNSAEVPFIIDLTLPEAGKPTIMRENITEGEMIKIKIKATDSLTGVEDIFIVIEGQNYSMEREGEYFWLKHPFDVGLYTIAGFYIHDYAGNLDYVEYNTSFRVEERPNFISLSFASGGGGSITKKPVFKEGFNVLTPELMKDLLKDQNMLQGEFYKTNRSIYPTLVLTARSKGKYPAPDMNLGGLNISILKGDLYELCAQEVLTSLRKAESIVIARGDIEADSISAIAYAKAINAPILLTDPIVLPEVIYNATEALKPEKIIIIGGEKAISREVEWKLAMLAGVRRIAGKNREETAANVAGAIKETAIPDTIIIADGERPAAEAAILAYSLDAPVLYSNAEEIPPPTKEFLKNIDQKTKIILVGLGNFELNYLIFSER